MTEKELLLVNNVAQKLEIYMQRNNQTIFALAKAIGIDKQPFYRIMNRKNVPTLSSLFIIAENLNCTIQELINHNVFIDIPVYSGFNLNKVESSYRIYISYGDYQILKEFKLFAIKLLKELKIYYRLDDFINDGFYLVNYNGQIIEMDILSAGAKLIIASIDGNEHRIESPQLIAVAKFYKTIPIASDNCYAIYSNKMES